MSHIIGFMAVAMAFVMLGALVGHALMYADQCHRARRRDLLKRAAEASARRKEREISDYVRERAIRDQFDRESA